MGGGRACTHLKLVEAGCPGVLGTGLPIHGRGTDDVRRHILLQGCVGTQAGSGMVEAKEGVHLAHDLNNLQLVLAYRPLGVETACY